jgi:hypothetical protein
MKRVSTKEYVSGNAERKIILKVSPKLYYSLKFLRRRPMLQKNKG